MDIRAWEQGSSLSYDGAYHIGQHDDQSYYKDSDELLPPEEYEEILFQRVLDKIRVARAAGNVDVQLSAEELDAYQSKLHGARPPSARPQSSSRPIDAPMIDTASVASVKTKHAHLSRTRREKQRTSLFGSKSKRDKDKDRLSHRKRISTSPIIAGHPPAQSSPGFVIPGPEGHPVFAPINAYQGNLSRDQLPSHPTSRSTSGTQQAHTPPQLTPPRDVVGAFPGSEHAYRPTPPQEHPQIQSQSHPHHQIPSLSVRQQAYDRERQLEVQGLLSSAQAQAARRMPFPVEMYQYQALSPASGSISPSSPQMPHQLYVRRVSSGQSEASYTSMPRRVPVPTAPPAPVPLQRSVTGSSGHESGAMGQGFGLGVEGVDLGLEQEQGTVKASGSGSGNGERRRKSGKGVRRKKDGG